MIGGSDEYPDSIRQIAQLNLYNVFESRTRLLDENSATFRWILASLLTINGGALIALLSSYHIDIAGKIISGRYFCAGIFFAFFLAYITSLSSVAALNPLMSLADFWISALKTGELDEDDAQQLKELQTSMKSAVRPYSIASHVSGWLSVLGCLLGAFMAGPYLK